MKQTKTKYTQLAFDFSVLKKRTKVSVSGYDSYHYKDLTGAVGVVDSYSPKSGEYSVYFKGQTGLIPNHPLILSYKRNQLEVVPGRGRCSWEKYLEREYRKKRSREKEK
ncbi:hypothetical protein [Argonema antarcticum]|uniref:hypothetical protein n=1 Tax=Argonema antarcticum TaxID=2942763 RepID=UPI0020121FD1|nr:hypothetical protein [Argonema antarcticum]MCL1474683.1 hypothetical protein [Argonema antarcticum A004/B2]